MGSIIVAILMFLGGALVGVLVEIGTVQSDIQPYTKQLSTKGVLYTVVCSDGNDGNRVILLKGSTGEYQTIRIAGPIPPSPFVLVDDNPVAVIAPSAAK